MRNPADENTGREAGKELTDDAFLGGKLHLLQPRRGYRAGIDAVLLAAAIPTGADRYPPTQPPTLLDVGAGVGTVGLCAARRTASLSVTLLEREAQLVDLARKNITRNGLDERVYVQLSDVTARGASPLSCQLPPESFSIVVANPPYADATRGTLSSDPLKRNSHALGPDETLDQWCRFLARMCRPGGLAIIIHTTESLGPILGGFNGRFGAVTIQPLHPRNGEEANRIIVTARKGQRGSLRLLPGIPLHGNGNAFTPRIASVLREGTGLDLPI